MSNPTYATKEEAEEGLSTTYVEKVISVEYVDTYKNEMVTKIDKLDRLSIDHKNMINLFFVDDSMVCIHKDDFFEHVKLIN